MGVRIKRIIGLAIPFLALFLSFTVSNAHAQDFPNKPITVVVPWSAGTLPDVILRTASKEAEKDLGVPVVVTNIPGGTSTKGTAFVRNAPADGYTVLDMWVAGIIGRLMNPDVGYEIEDFDAIGGYFFNPFMIMVNQNHPANNLEEFVAWAGEQDKNINVGVCGAGSVARMAMEQFLNVAEISNYNPVPFGGCNVDNHKGVLDGSLDVTTASMGGPNTFGDKVKVLATLTGERIATLPDVPTSAEAGYSLNWNDRTSLGWGGLAIRSGTPADRVKILQDAFGKVLSSEAFVTKIREENKSTVSWLPGDEFKQLWVDSEVELTPIIDSVVSKGK